MAVAVVDELGRLVANRRWPRNGRLDGGVGRGMKTTILLLAALTAFAAQPIAAQDPESLTPSEILARSVEAMGGAERFARIRKVRAERTLEPLPAGSQPKVRTLQVATFPHTMEMTAESGETTTLLRYEVMRVDRGTERSDLAPASAATRTWFRGFYWREWWVIYARYAWHGLGEVWLEALPMEVRDGRRCYGVSVEPRDAPAYRLYVDAETWRPAQRIFSAGDQEVVDRFLDYRRFDGVFFPTRIESSVDGKPAEDIRYLGIELELDTEPLTLRRRLNEILEASRAEKGIPGMVAYVQQGSTRLLHRAYGEESLELGQPMRLDSVLPLASVSKVFAGTAAMRLVEKGMLDLDASIASYLDGVPSEHADVTTRHLLNHSHGLPELVPDRRGPAGPSSSEENAVRANWLELAFSHPAVFEPGADWSYSQTGYRVLQEVLEVASGKGYEELIATEILDPLGLGRARFGGSDRIVPGRPGMDYVWSDGLLTYNYLNYHPDAFTAAGLNATAQEVATFYRAIADGELITAASRDEMWREVVLDGGGRTYYGLGWGSYRTTFDGRWSVGHSGGGSSWTRYFPDQDLIVVVLSNLNGAREDKLVYDLAHAVSQAGSTTEDSPKPAGSSPH